jgi:biopolymer transport protein ExbB
MNVSSRFQRHLAPLFLAPLLTAVHFFPLNALAQAAAAPVPPKAAEESLKLWSLVEKGGWAMVPLGVLSVIAVMLAIGYLISLRKGAVVSKQYIATIEVLLRKRDLLGVLAVSNRHSQVVARIVQKTLDFATKNPSAPFESLKEVAEAEGSSHAASLSHRITYLADIGILAPMVGLLGTVVGIIRAFGTLGSGSPGLSRDILLASGVSEALVATAAGLVLAVISATLYALFRNRAQSLISEMESATTYVVGLLAVATQRRRDNFPSDEA